MDMINGVPTSVMILSLKLRQSVQRWSRKPEFLEKTTSLQQANTFVHIVTEATSWYHMTEWIHTVYVDKWTYLISIFYTLNNYNFSRSPYWYPIKTYNPCRFSITHTVLLLRKYHKLMLVPWQDLQTLLHNHRCPFA